jgi:hypothetical protein
LPETTSGQSGGRVPGMEAYLPTLAATGRRLGGGLAAGAGGVRPAGSVPPVWFTRMSTGTQAQGVIRVRICSRASYLDAAPKPDDAPPRPPLPAGDAAALGRIAAVGLRGRAAPRAARRLVAKGLS